MARGVGEAWGAGEAGSHGLVKADRAAFARGTGEGRREAPTAPGKGQRRGTGFGFSV